MAITYTLIASSTIGSTSVSSIDFTSIPGTYTDLNLFCSLRTDNTNSSYGETINIKFNDTTSPFTVKRIEAYGGSTQSSSETDGRFGRVNNNNSSQTANLFSNISTYIGNYASTSVNKSFMSDSILTTDNTSFNEMFLYANIWSSTSAITKISIVPTESGSKFVQYSTAYLYGIKKD